MTKKDTGESSAKDKTGLWDGKNYPFPVFDRALISWCRAKWGEGLGRAIWENEFPVGLFDIPEETSEWIEYCEMDYRHNQLDLDFKKAKALYEDDIFWTHEYQENWLGRQFEYLYSHVESRVEGQAEKALVTGAASNS